MGQSADRRIAIIAPLKGWGGIEGKVVTLCAEFLKVGVAVDLVLPRGGEVPYPDRLSEDVRIVDLESDGKLDTAVKFARYLRRTSPAAILAAKDHAVKAALLARLFSWSRVPVFIKLTNTVSVTLRRPLKRYIARILYPLADGAIAVSNGVRADFLRYFAMDPKRVVTIFNPTIPDDFSSRAEAEVVHEWLGDDGIPVVMGVGRLESQKGFDVLLQAFARVRKDHQVRLVILGEGSARNELEEQARALGVEQDVDLVGSVPDVLPWVSRASLYVLSSRYEGLPNVLIEALAAGAPVVSTDCPSGPREILEDGRLGPLVPVDNVEALAEAMEKTINNPPPEEERERSLERFRSGPVARQYLEAMGLLEPATDSPDGIQ